MTTQDAKEIFRGLMEEQWQTIQTQFSNNIRVGTVTSFNKDVGRASVNLLNTGEILSNVLYPKGTIQVRVGDTVMIVTSDPKVKGQNYIVGVYGQWVDGYTAGDFEVEDDLTIGGTITQDDWTAPTLLNSWVNYGAEYNPAGYFRDKNGIVHLRGLVKNGSSATAIMFILPAEYRPAYKEHLSSHSAASACRIDILANGTINCPSGGSTTWTSIDGITFRASGY